jgi:hypothetical protein
MKKHQMNKPRSKYFYVYVYRSSVTGLFVTKAYYIDNADTTFKQLIRHRKRK